MRGDGSRTGRRTHLRCHQDGVRPQGIADRLGNHRDDLSKAPGHEAFGGDHDVQFHGCATAYHGVRPSGSGDGVGQIAWDPGQSVHSRSMTLFWAEVPDREGATAVQSPVSFQPGFAPQERFRHARGDLRLGEGAVPDAHLANDSRKAVAPTAGLAADPRPGGGS